MVSKIKKIRERKAIGYVLKYSQKDKTYLVEMVNGNTPSLMELRHENLRKDGDLQVIDETLYRLEEEDICANCRNYPLYDEKDRPYCPVCAEK